MWALGESLEVIGQDIKVYFKTKVVNIDCEKTQIITEGDATGQFTFDLIVGADGVGSVVRKAMVEQLPEVSATRITGEEYAYTLYMDNQEIVSKMDPKKLYLSSLLGNIILEVHRAKIYLTFY